VTTEDDRAPIGRVIDVISPPGAPDGEALVRAGLFTGRAPVVAQGLQVVVEQDLADLFNERGAAGLALEVMRVRAVCRWMLSQRSDDVCWRDVYQAVADVLPGGREALAALALSAPPEEVMLHNCRKFVGELCAGGGEGYAADSPEAIVKKQAERIKELERELAALSDGLDGLPSTREGWVVQADRCPCRRFEPGGSRCVRPVAHEGDCRWGIGD
jgi:hypothetical protein